MVISAVIFDCDGVLINSEEIGLGIELAHLREIGLAFDAEDYKHRFLGSTWDAFHAAIEKEALLRTGKPVPEDYRDSLGKKLRAAFEEELAAIKGVADLLAALALPKAVASSALEHSLQWKLERTGLKRFFGEHIYSTERVKHGKPAPDLFLYAAKRINADPATTLVVEDSVNGIMAARAAGMIAVGFCGGGHCSPGHDKVLHAAGAHHAVSSHAELRRLLAL